MAERKKSSPRTPEIVRPPVPPEVTKPGSMPEVAKPENGVVEFEGGVMLTTSEILDFAEGADSD
ncbi:MAG: hypothetical protein GXX89_04550 [Clostridiales bacterium]|jgi:hypothetical protein|nr:hypothetical protein [Clostridiales bacterium]